MLKVFRSFMRAAVLVGATAIPASLFSLFELFPHVTTVFLVPVLLAAITGGIGPALFAALLSVGVCSVLYFHPVYSLDVEGRQDLLDLAMFSLVAVLTGHLTSEIRRRAEESERRRMVAEALRELGTDIPDDVSEAEFLERLAATTASTVGRTVTVAPPGAAPSPATRRMTIPLSDGSAPALLIDTGGGLPAETLELAQAFADRAAIIIERRRLARGKAEAAGEAAAARLRTALISAVTHDLRTPLASIIGAATALSQYASLYDDSARRDMTVTIREEAERLNRYVGNLLDKSRLDAGALRPNPQSIDLSDLVETALRRLTSMADRFTVTFTPAPDLPMLHVDPILMEQVIVNLLENSFRYAPPGSKVDITAVAQGDMVRLEVLDEGPGVPEQERDAVFERFYRGGTGDRRVAGSGLGLFICKGFVEAHGGRIAIGAPLAGLGARVTVDLPVAAPEAIDRRVTV